MKDYLIKKIITPTVLPLHDSAVTDWSEHLSSTFKAQLMLYNAVRTESAERELGNTAQGNKVNDLLKSSMGLLRDLGNSLKRAHEVRYVVEVSNNWRNLVKQAQDESADLLVTRMPSVGESTPGRLTAMMYNSPCPVFFVREGMPVKHIKKIFVPIRKKDGMEQLLPYVIEWAKTFGATIRLSTYEQDGASSKDRLRVMQRAASMADSISNAGINLETETAHGFHFGTTTLQRMSQTGSDMVAIAVQPNNYLTRLFNKMVGPFFLENSPKPILSIPVTTAPGNTAGDSAGANSNKALGTTMPG